MTLHEALKAADTLANAGNSIRVLDLFTIKPLDVSSIIQHAKQCHNRVVVVEDHYEEGECVAYLDFPC